MQERGGIARAFAHAGLQRLADFFAVGVILQALRVHHRVAKHRAVARDPGQPVVIGRHLRKILLAALLHGGGGQLQFIAQLLLLHAAEVFVKAAHNDEQARRQHRSRHQQNRTKYLSGHAFASSR